MKIYRALVSLAIALSAVFGVWYLSSLFASMGKEYAATLTYPVYAPSAVLYEWLQCGYYILLILVLAFSVLRAPLRKTLIPCGIALALSIPESFVFYVWHLPLLSLSFVFIKVAVLTVLTGLLIKKTRELWIAMIPVLSWSAYCFLVNYGLVILN